MIVIGIGNDFRGDDAAGLAAARLLRNRLSADVRVSSSRVTAEPCSMPYRTKTP